jgi:N-acetylglucosaminyldiphosphoundecaprenol N-acetyl-beta-D-mannosaminyltransferase
LIASQKDEAFRDSVIHSDLSLADGMPIIWMAKLLNLPIHERVAGASLFDALRYQPLNAGERPLRIYFFGGPDGVAQRAHEAINQDSGSMECCGYMSPGFGSIEEMSTLEILHQINATEADFVVVSLGAKKGQAWIERNRTLLNAPVISHLGAVVNFVAGTVQRAPIWVQRIGAEWVWRIKEEPHLTKRYLKDGLYLVYLLLKHLYMLPKQRFNMKNTIRKYKSKLYSLTGNIRTYLSRPSGSPRILILGVYLSDKANAAEHLIIEYQSSKHCVVTQKWVCIGNKPKSDLLKNATVLHCADKVPKFELLNKLIAAEDLSKFDFIIFSDDDIYIQRNFVDRYIALQQKFNLALAQPARTIDSTCDHGIVMQNAKYVARETNFVEIGPIFSIEKSIFHKILPFDLSSPMGFGYDHIWPKILGAGRRDANKQGILDALPVIHNMRPQASAYKADIELSKMYDALSDTPHISESERFKTY